MECAFVIITPTGERGNPVLGAGDRFLDVTDAANAAWSALIRAGLLDLAALSDDEIDKLNTVWAYPVDITVGGWTVRVDSAATLLREAAQARARRADLRRALAEAILEGGRDA